MTESKIRIKIGTIGYLPFKLNQRRIQNCKTNIFEIVGDIEEYYFNNNSDTECWGYSDETLDKELRINYEADFFVGITYAPLEKNYFVRRLENNRIVVSYYEMYQILTDGHIPLENLIMRTLYAYSLIFLKDNKLISHKKEIIAFNHDDTRGCLFDMNGNKRDVLFSLHKPIICDDCVNRFQRKKIWFSDKSCEITKFADTWKKIDFLKTS